MITLSLSGRLRIQIVYQLNQEPIYLIGQHYLVALQTFKSDSGFHGPELSGDHVLLRQRGDPPILRRSDDLRNN